MADYKMWLTHEGLLKIEGWAKDGLTNEQIAHNIGIDKTTLYRWKRKHKLFSEALRKGKEVVDREVENALLKRALGYKFTETTKKPVVNPVTGNNELSVVKIVESEKEPDTLAIIYWLKNRKPEQWRDKKRVDVQGELTNPYSALTTEELRNIVEMSDEELSERIDQLKSKLI